MTERSRKKHRNQLSVVHSPNSHKSYSQVRLNPGARNSTGVSNMCDRNLHQVIMCCLQRVLWGSQIGSTVSLVSPKGIWVSQGCHNSHHLLSSWWFINTLSKQQTLIFKTKKSNWFSRVILNLDIMAHVFHKGNNWLLLAKLPVIYRDSPRH